MVSPSNLAKRELLDHCDQCRNDLAAGGFVVMHGSGMLGSGEERVYGGLAVCPHGVKFAMTFDLTLDDVSPEFERLGIGPVKPPTGDQCNVHAEVTLADGRKGIAGWFPSLGGYAGKMVAKPDPVDGCIDVLVWHDGDFPFDGGEFSRGESPRQLHICDAEQWVSFGQWLGIL